MSISGIGSGAALAAMAAAAGDQVGVGVLRLALRADGEQAASMVQALLPAAGSLDGTGQHIDLRL